MNLVKPSFEILHHTYRPLHLVEQAGRICYKSEDKITIDSAGKFCDMLLSRNHESVLEHASVTVKIICDRGVSHELVRHRLASFSQESTRYCNYKGGVTFVIPPWVSIDPGEYKDIAEYPTKEAASKYWFNCMYNAEAYYVKLSENGWTPQQARSILPNSLKTEIVITTNLREWRHIFKLRAHKAAHPQMREIIIPMLAEFKKIIPVIFDNLTDMEAM